MPMKAAMALKINSAVRLPTFTRLEVKQLGSTTSRMTNTMKGACSHQAGQQQLVVPDQPQVALHQHGELAQEFHQFDWSHRLSASCAASGQAATRRLNSGVV